MKIAIVDDEQEQRELHCEYCRQYAHETGVKMETVTFESGDALLQDYKVDFDIIIFDIDMPGTNGMDTAKQVREVDKKVTLLFMTNMAQYAIDGYAVEAIDYVIKPIGYYEFSMKFRKAINSVVKKKVHMVIIDAVDGIHSVSTSHIFYVEVMSHHLLFHTSGGIFKARGSMSEQKEKLAAYHFCQVYRFYLINLEHVEGVQTKKEIYLKDGFPITNKKNKENHGVGLRSIKTLAPKYGGDIRFSLGGNNMTKGTKLLALLWGAAMVLGMTACGGDESVETEKVENVTYTVSFDNTLDASIQNHNLESRRFCNRKSK